MSRFLNCGRPFWSSEQISPSITAVVSNLQIVQVRRNRENGPVFAPTTASFRAAFCAVLVQLRVLGFGFFQNVDVGVSVFPELTEHHCGSSIRRSRSA